MSTQNRLTYTEQLQLRKAAGLLGAIQASAWIVMSIICLVLYIHGTVEYFEVNSYMDKVKYLMYAVLLSRRQDSFPKQALKPSVFFGFMWGYLFLDVAWLISSLIFFVKQRDAKQIPNDIKVWAFTTYLICLLDLVTTVMLGVDYSNCLDILTVSNIILEESCANGILPPLVIAAKGFVLWLVNLIFAWIMYKMYYQMMVHTRLQQQLQEVDFRSPYVTFHPSQDLPPRYSAPPPYNRQLGAPYSQQPPQMARTEP